MVNIAEVLAHGIAFDPKNWHGRPMDDLSRMPEAVGRLFDALKATGSPFTLVGGVALLNYIAGRNTQDVDVILGFEAAQRVPGMVLKEVGKFFAQAEFEGLRVDLLFPTLPVHRLIQERYSELLQYGEMAIPTATAEGIFLMKLFALPSLYRQFAWTKVAIYEGDVLALLGTKRIDSEALLEVLAGQVLPSDLVELRKIVKDAESKLRTQRF